MDRKIRQQHQTGRKRGKAKTRLIRTQGNGYGLKRMKHIPLQYAVDKQEGVKNPIGMHGFRLDVDAHIINASYSDIENLTKSVNGAGISINQLIFNPLASAEAVLSEDEKQYHKIAS